mgnify:CR=1 FL=1
MNEDFCFEGDTYNISKAEDCPSEDAFFSTPKGVGISDGVGSWNNYGIDSYRFSNTLMQECQNLINKVIMYKQKNENKAMLLQLQQSKKDIECNIIFLIFLASFSSFRSILTSNTSKYSNSERTKRTRTDSISFIK